MSEGIFAGEGLHLSDSFLEIPVHRNKESLAFDQRRRVCLLEEGSEVSPMTQSTRCLSSQNLSCKVSPTTHLPRQTTPCFNLFPKTPVTLTEWPTSVTGAPFVARFTFSTASSILFRYLPPNPYTHLTLLVEVSQGVTSRQLGVG